MVILHWEDNFQPLFKCIVNAFLSNEGFETILIFFLELFHDRGRYHVENSPLICSANHWTGFYMITAFIMKELIKLSRTAVSVNQFMQVTL